MDIFRNLDTSASGMSANRVWMDAITDNIANANTTKTGTGRPYQAKKVSFSSVLDNVNRPGTPAGLGLGVRANGVTQDTSPFSRVYNPSHPDATPDGYVEMPNVNPTTEMVDMIIASRSYESNVAAFNTGRGMYMKAMEIGK